MPDSNFLTCDCRSFSSNLERDLAAYMIRAMKFEHYLCQTYNFRKTSKNKLLGVKWKEVAKHIQGKQPFENYSFDDCAFKYLKDNPPGYLVQNDDALKWKKQKPIKSWSDLLAKGLAQLRNNLAHGSKAIRPETEDGDRLKSLLSSGKALMDFIAIKVDPDSGACWESTITFLP